MGNHDLDVGLVEPGVLRHQVARQVRVLGGEMQDHPVALRLDEDRVALDRGDGDALVLHPQPDHDVGAVEGVGVVGVAHRRGDVAAEVGELQRGVIGERGLHVGDHGKLVVVDVDQLGRVHRLGAGLRDHEGDRVADVAGRVTGERGPEAGLVDDGEGRHRFAAQGLRRVDGHDPRRRLRLAGVHAGDPGVGEGAADEDRLEGAVDPEVVDVVAGTDDEIGILDPPDGVPEDRSGAHLGHDPRPSTAPDTASGCGWWGGVADVTGT